MAIWIAEPDSFFMEYTQAMEFEYALKITGISTEASVL